MPLVTDDLMAPDVKTDPHSYYLQMRELDPVFFNERWCG